MAKYATKKKVTGAKKSPAFKGGEFWKTLQAERKTLKERYLPYMPKTIPPGRIVVHNQMLPSAHIGLRGFRIWLSSPKWPDGRPTTDRYVKCRCGWAPHLPEHYRVRGRQYWTKKQSGT